MKPLRRLLRKIGRWLLRHSGEDLRPLESLPNAPDLFHTFRAWTCTPSLTRRPGGWDYQGKFYPDYLTVGGASCTIARTAAKYCRGSGADIGAGLWPLPGAVPMDIWRGAGADRPLSSLADASLDYVFSSHCLEHVVEWEPELTRWISKLKSGGVLFLYLPHPECGIWNPGSPMVGSEHKWQPTPAIIKKALRQRDMEIVECDDGPDAMMSFFVCGRRNNGPQA